jgi:glutathione S-transferase
MPREPGQIHRKRFRDGGIDQKVGGHMQAYFGVAIVTLLASLVCFGMSAMVARTHARTGILAPTMTGDPLLERTIRGHLNTLEWIPIFLPSMWLFAIYWSPLWAAALGSLWIVGRIIYFIGYRAAAQKRFPGFFIQVCATFALLLGALGRIIYLMATAT